MKKAWALFLGIGVVGSQLFSQELSLRFNLPDQLDRRETAREGIARWNIIGPSRLNMRSGEVGSLRRLNVQSHGGPSVFAEALRKTMRSDTGALEKNDPQGRRIQTQRLVSGLGLAFCWVTTVVVDAFVLDIYRKTTVIPVAGPWITLARMASRHDPGWEGSKELLALSGIAQTGLATYFIISLIRHPKPRETKNVGISAGFTTINLKIQF